MSTATFGPVPGTADQSRQKKKKIAIVGSSALILVAMVVGVAVGVSRHNAKQPSDSDGSSGELQSSTKAIQSICQPTDYREECEQVLSKTAGNSTDPKVLVQAAFNATLDHIREAFNHSELLKQAAEDPRTSGALNDCKELLDYAIDDLQNSFAKLGAIDITKIEDIADDLKVWLSAVITYQETCLDGFEKTTGDAAEAMQKALQSSMQLTSNVLAIINEISQVLSSFNLNLDPFVSRRLLAEDENEANMEGFPSWVTNAKRRLLAAHGGVKPNVVVAQDGSGDCKTINEALGRIPQKTNASFVIYIKAGVYKENVQVARTMTNVMMYGDGATKTKITGNLNYIDGTPTFKSATFAAIGDGFMARDLGFENSAGPEKHQAVALRVQSDRAIFYHCQMDGYQDTLYTHTKRQFYRECTISGTIDFVFGDAASVLQNCLLLVRKPMDNQQNIVTAQGRKDRHEATGTVLHNCTVSADPAYVPFKTKMPSFLGRPWKQYSRTIVMQSQIDDLIDPKGWLPWEGTFGLSTCFYTEVDNRGPGAGTAGRVNWRGVKKIDLNHAQKFTVETFIQGNQWLKAAGVPYIPGLLPAAEQGRIH